MDSLRNLRTRFLRTYTPLLEELQQTGEYTDICIRADYCHLLPHYIEWEMRDRLLYLQVSLPVDTYFTDLSPYQSR